MKCTIVGATGYTGMELIRILARHPSVQMSYLTTRQKKSISVHKLIPKLPKRIKLKVEPFSWSRVKAEGDVVFVCLPHTQSMQAVERLHRMGKIVIDLSADYRLQTAKDYLAAYGVKHLFPKKLKEAVYGLSEWNADKIKKSNLIANPGCYPTGAALGMIPLLKEGLVQSDSIVVDSKSGVSGAGKSFKLTKQYEELPENFYAYKVNCHQHAWEIGQSLKSFSGKKIGFNFVPHLLPVERGILSTLYLRAKKGVTLGKVRKAFQKSYGKSPFVRLKQADEFPKLKDVQHTNYCDIGFTFDARTKSVIVLTSIDNLVKGAAGQAVQNMNIRLGLKETAGLVS